MIQRDAIPLFNAKLSARSDQLGSANGAEPFMVAYGAQREPRSKPEGKQSTDQS